MLSNQEILDLYEDLLAIGAAETPEEEAKRVSGYLSGCKNLKQASELLDLKKIPHTFYRIVSWYDSKENERDISIWILSKDLSIFRSTICDTEYVSSSHNASAKELIRVFKNFYDHSHEFHHDTYDDLPERSILRN